MSQQDRPAAASQRVRRQDDPGHDNGQQPAPAPFDEVLIQGIVGPGEIGAWHRDEVCNQGDSEYRAAVDGHLEPGVEEQRLLAHMQQHGDQDKAYRARCRGRSGAATILLLRTARSKVHPARTRNAAGVTGRTGVPGRRVDAASLTRRHRRAWSSVIDDRRHLESSHWANLLGKEHAHRVLRG